MRLISSREPASIQALLTNFPPPDGKQRGRKGHWIHCLKQQDGESPCLKHFICICTVHVICSKYLVVGSRDENYLPVLGDGVDSAVFCNESYIVGLALFCKNKELIA